MTPWGFVGKRRLEMARDTFPDVWKGWQRNWCFNSVQVSDELLVEEMKPDMTQFVSWWQVSRTDGVIWLGCTSSFSWHELLFSGLPNQPPEDDLACAMAEHARRALVNALLESAGHGPVEQLVQGRPDLGAHPSPHICIMSADRKLCVLLEASILDACMPTTKVRELVKREQAIGACRVRLKVSLPLSTVSAASLGQLHPGDVLQTQVSLSQRFQLELSDGPEVPGYLVRNNTQLAFQLADN